MDTEDTGYTIPEDKGETEGTEGYQGDNHLHS